MSSTKKQALLVGAVLGLAALAGETRYQYQHERAAVEKGTAFYDCCGLSRLELIKTKAVIRILRENPRPYASVDEASRTVRAWSMAVDMTKVDVLRPELNKVFYGYGIRAERLLKKSQVSRADLTNLEQHLHQLQSKKGPPSELSEMESLQLMRLHAMSPAMASLSHQALTVFEATAVRQGYKYDQESLLNGVTYYGPATLGRLAICVMEPSLLQGGTKQNASFFGCLRHV